MKSKEELLKMKPLQRKGYFPIQRNALVKKYYEALDSSKHAKIYTFVFAIGGIVGFLNPNYAVVNILLLLGAGATYLVSRSYEQKAQDIRSEINSLDDLEREVKKEVEKEEKIKKEKEEEKIKYKQEEQELENEIVEVKKKIEILQLYKNNYANFITMYENGVLESYLESINYDEVTISYLMEHINNSKKQTMKLTMNNK